MLRCEAMLEFTADAGAVKCAQSPHGFDRLILSLHDKAGQPVMQHLGDRAVLKRDDGSSTGHRLNHYESEGFAPRDWEEERRGIPQEFLFLVLGNLTNELNIALREQRLDRGFEILPIDAVHLGRDLEGNAGPRCDSNRGVRRLFWGDAPQKGEISPRPAPMLSRFCGRP